MLEPVIKVNFKPNGKGGTITKIEVENAPDNSCLSMTKSVEEALGKVTKRSLKPEAHRDQQAAESVKVGH